MMIAERLAAALRSGTLLDLVPNTERGVPLDEDEMRGWGKEHEVDAGILRGLLLRRGLDEGGGGSDPRGLRLRGARIRGRLDLDFLECSVALFLEDCLLERGVTAQQASLSTLRLRRCRLEHPDEPPFLGDYLRVDGWLDLSEVVVSAKSEEGAVRLLNARVGRLSMTSATVRNSAGAAIFGEGIQTDGGIFLDQRFVAEGFGERGAVRLSGAQIGGQLSLRTAKLRNPEGPALLADSLQASGDVAFSKGFVAEGSSERGAVRLLGARIHGQLNLREATLRNPKGPALHASWIQTLGTLYLERGFCADGSGDRGAVRLLGARIGGQLSLREATLCNRTGPVLQQHF
jgi:hypothetical protein